MWPERGGSGEDGPWAAVWLVRFHETKEGDLPLLTPDLSQGTWEVTVQQDMGPEPSGGQELMGRLPLCVHETNLPTFPL